MRSGAASRPGSVRLRHLIVDRDGVLNREAPAGAYIADVENFHFLPGALEALRRLRAAGVRVSVATNQAGVGRGLMSLEQLSAVHEHMQSEALANGGRLDAVLFCPHAPDANCQCRKPAPGLIQSAIERSGIAAAETLVVGDDRRDVEAARRAGVRAALVRTGKGREAEGQLRSDDILVYDDLLQLACALVPEGG